MRHVTDSPATAPAIRPRRCWQDSWHFGLDLATSLSSQRPPYLLSILACLLTVCLTLERKGVINCLLVLSMSKHKIGRDPSQLQNAHELCSLFPTFSLFVTLLIEIRVVTWGSASSVATFSYYSFWHEILRRQLTLISLKDWRHALSDIHIYDSKLATGQPVVNCWGFGVVAWPQKTLAYVAFKCEVQEDGYVAHHAFYSRPILCFLKAADIWGHFIGKDQIISSVNVPASQFLQLFNFAWRILICKWFFV